jgi:hypothetical protein
MTHRLRSVLATVALSAAFVSAPAAQHGTPANSSANKVSVAVFGDWPYSQALLDAAPTLIGSVNGDPQVRLVIHVGDIHSGSMPCTGAGWESLPAGSLPASAASAPDWDLGIYDLFQQFKDPVIYTPGDNEWTDCHKKKEFYSGAPLAELATVRRVFFGVPGVTLGKEKTVVSQANAFDPSHPDDAQFVENVMFEESRVVFVTLNVPGSDDDGLAWTAPFTDEAARKAEKAARDAANLRWLDAAFDQAEADGAAGVVIAIQANMWDPEAIAAGGDGLDQYTPFVSRLAARSVEFGKPVLLLNGDSHVYMADQPLADPTSDTGVIHGTGAVSNLWRITVQGSTNTPWEWLKLTIDPKDPGVFSWTNVVYGP